MDIFGGILGLICLFGIIFTIIFIRLRITAKAEQARAAREQAAAQLAPRAASARASYRTDDPPPPPPTGW